MLSLVSEWARQPTATTILLIVRLLVAIAGSVYALIGWQRAHRDIGTVRESGRNGPLLVVSEWAARTERSRSGMQGAMLMAALYELTAARWLLYELWAGTIPVGLYYANSGVWLFISGSLMALSMLELRDRRQLVLSSPSRFAASFLRIRKLLGYSGDAVVTLKPEAETKKPQK